MSKASKKHTPICTAARALAIVLGFAAGGLGAFGAYQLQASIDGPTSYLAIAAPVVAIAAALLPCLAERAWRAGHRLNSLVLWAVLIPAGAVVFFGAAERVHASKAGAEAERQAVHTAAARAEAELTEARAAAKAATAAADKVRGLNDKACGPKCQSIRASETAARGRVAEADAAVRQAQGQAVAEATLKAPVWLLPAALDLVAFAFISTGLVAAPASAKAPAKGRSRAKSNKVKAKAKAKAKPARTLRLVAANDH